MKKYRNDLESLKRRFVKIQDQYITAKSKETLMGAELEDVLIRRLNHPIGKNY